VRSPDKTESRVPLLVGSVKQNVAPRGGLSAAHKRPPCDSTMERLIRSPIPVPMPQALYVMVGGLYLVSAIFSHADISS